MATVGAIVAAAGTGSRLGRGSKALVRLNGRTTLARVLELFLALDEVDRIVAAWRRERPDLDVAPLEVLSETIVLRNWAVISYASNSHTWLKN